MDHDPPFDVVGPDGRRVTILPSGPTDSIRDLGRALGADEGDTVWIDGAPVDAHVRLRAAPIRHGSRVDLRAGPEPCEVGRTGLDDMPEQVGQSVQVAIVAGPACTPWARLEVGRHRLGRAADAVVRIDDDGVEPHLGVLDVDPTGAGTFTQLTGRTPVLAPGGPVGGPTGLADGDELVLGPNRVRIRRRPAALGDTRPGTISVDPTSPWRRIVHRGAGAARSHGHPVEGDEGSPARMEVPGPLPERRPPPATGLVGAGVAVLGGTVLAAVLGHLLMALFGIVGALASAGTWAAGWIGARRARRADRVAHDEAVDRFARTAQAAHDARRREHRERHLPVNEVLTDLDRLRDGASTTVWCRRVVPSDALTATVGPGVDHWTAPLSVDDRRRLTPHLERILATAERLDDVAVPVALWPGSVTALHGRRGPIDALCRSILVQLAAAHGPADLHVQIVTERPGVWAWATWLPHGPDGTVSVIGPDGDLPTTTGSRTEHGPRLLLVTDAPALLTTRTSPLRRLLAASDATCLVVVDDDDPVPAVCEQVVAVGATGRVGSSAVAAGITVDAAAHAARQLAPLVDPESGGDHDASDLRLGDLLGDLLGHLTGEPAQRSVREPAGERFGGFDPARIVRGWAAAGSDPPPAAVVGSSVDGVVEIDLVRHGPHGLVAGTTGSGKSELLRTLVLSLAVRSGPAHLTFVLIDYKGGATFDACARLPHTVGCVTDLDDGLAARALTSLDAEIRRREHLLRDAAADDLAGHRRLRPDEPLPRLIVVVDEFATLARDLPGFLASLVSIAQRGRSLGVHLLLATQRPAGVVTDDIRANTDLRIALRLTDAADATDVVGDPSPSQFSRSRPGRAALQLAPDELVIFQTASCTGPARRSGARTLDVVPQDDITCADGRKADTEQLVRRTELDDLVDAIRCAAELAGVEAPHRPWIDPLPHPLRLQESGRGLGLVDDPARQCHRPLIWSPTAGNLRLVGSVGAGTTTALVALAAELCRSTTPDQLHVYVLDARGDSRLARLAQAPHCGAVVGITETERVDRLLRRLADEIDRRTGSGGRTPQIVLVIDGLEALRASVGTVERAASAERLARVLAAGPDAGVVTCSAMDGTSAAALAAPAADSWLFHTADADVARAVGVAGAAVAAGLPGRFVVASTGLTAQIAVDAADPGRLPSAPVPAGAGPAPVEELPSHVECHVVDAVAVVERPCDGAVRLPIGVAADDLAVDFLELGPGDHVLVAGAARTGATTALWQVTCAWRRQFPAGRIVTLERSSRIGREFLVPDEAGSPQPPLLVVVDDADRVDDPDGVLEAIARGRHPGTTIVAAGRLENLRAAYGHWTRDVARSRCGLVMSAAGDVDGDLLGVTLPRRSPICARPGLGWIVDRRGHRLVQVAARMPP